MTQGEAGVVKVGRNDPCPCGSGRKYKSCCEGKTTAKDALYSKALPILLGVALVSVLLLIATTLYSRAPRDEASGRVWSVEHGHWHDDAGQHQP
jgi:hypothetical protein